MCFCKLSLSFHSAEQFILDPTPVFRVCEPCRMGRCGVPPRGSKVDIQGFLSVTESLWKPAEAWGSPQKPVEACGSTLTTASPGDATCLMQASRDSKRSHLSPPLCNTPIQASRNRSTETACCLRAATQASRGRTRPPPLPLLPKAHTENECFLAHDAPPPSPPGNSNPGVHHGTGGTAGWRVASRAAGSKPRAAARPPRGPRISGDDHDNTSQCPNYAASTHPDSQGLG